MTRKAQMQDARDRLWTCQDISEAFGVSYRVVKQETQADCRGLTRKQRATLRWALGQDGLASAEALAPRLPAMTKNAARHLRALESQDFFERMDAAELSEETLEALGCPSVVWELTRAGVRAARDTVRQRVMA